MIYQILERRFTHISVLLLAFILLLCFNDTVLLHPQELAYTQIAPSSQIPLLLQKVHVSIPFHYDVRRLSNLYENLNTISRWEAQVDCCIGTNAPDKLLMFLHDASIATPFTRKVTICPVQDLSTPLLLNWRTRESMEVAFASPLNYTTFVFAEDDLIVTWEALLKWEEDIQILHPKNFTRTFFRYEISPQDGRPYSLDDVGGGVRRATIFNDAQDNARAFVQAGGSGTYSGMFVATRHQMACFIASHFWSCKYHLSM